MRYILSLLFLAFTLHAAEKPNIIFILADDLGVNDLACYGRKEHHTPNLDKLAAEARSTSDPAELDKVLARINTRMVDQAVFVWFVHDVWPNAISSKVKGYVHPKSWYVDFSPVTVG